jgi:hypothetical protein
LAEAVLFLTPLISHADGTANDVVEDALLTSVVPTLCLLGRCTCAIDDGGGELRRDVGEAGVQFALEVEVGLLGQVRRLQVVGTCFVVQVLDCDCPVAGFNALPFWVTEGFYKWRGTMSVHAQVQI